MKKFFALYMVPIDVIQKWMKNSSPDDMKKFTDRWMHWMKQNESMFSDQGTPLAKTKRVRKDGSADVTNDVTGYSIVMAESHEAATKLFNDSPHFEIPGAYIELLEIVPMPGT